MVAGAGVVRLMAQVGAVLAAFLATPGRAQAQELGGAFEGKPVYIESREIEEDRKRDNWSGRLGFGFSVLPDFVGADDYRIQPALDLKVAYRDTVFLENNKLGIKLYDHRLLRAGVIGRWTMGRRNDFTPANLSGIADVDDALEIGLFAGTALYKLFLTGEVYVGASKLHHGVTVEIEGGYTFELNSKLRLTPILGASWGSADYIRAYFGVDDGEEPFPVYQPGAGIYEIYSELSLEQRLGKRWLLKGSLRLSDLQGGAAHSPIVRGEEGNRAQLSTFLGVAWLF
ncbi:MAG: MipA/OmpV family protein [Alphaproteobacteria bacterium]|nr:MAG: MipA/OmpV family protein [Alphaproteobacteria bacterium]